MSGKSVWAGWQTWTGEFCSAKYFLVRALVIVVLFFIAHAAALKEYTTFLSGTAANPAVGYEVSAFCGMIYIALYLGSVVLAPVLVIAAGLLACWQRSASSRALVKTSGKSP